MKHEALTLTVILISGLHDNRLENERRARKMTSLDKCQKENYRLSVQKNIRENPYDISFGAKCGR